MEKGNARALPDTLMCARDAPGCSLRKASAVMPPIELPITQASLSMPSDFTTSKAALAPSSIDNSGKSSRYGWRVWGLMEAGPVEPLQLPSELTHTTKKRLLSIALPGPSIASHQPASALPSLAAAC